MLKYFLFAAVFFAIASQPAMAQEEDEKIWKFKGALGTDFAQLLFINPKVGAGENRIGLGVHAGFSAHYSKGRFSWDAGTAVNFGVQRLGRGKKIPFQKNIDEFRIGTNAALAIKEDKPFAYAIDATFLSQITPTFEGNYLSHRGTPISHPISQFVSPFTFTLSPGIAYKPSKGKLKGLNLLLSPASLKIVGVGSDSIAMLGNAAGTASLHGTPFGTYATEQEFKDDWHMKPRGLTPDSAYYSKMALQFGATLKATYANKFWKYQEGGKDKYRIAFATSLTLFSNYLRNPQHIDVEWTTQTDLFIFKGLSISLGTNLFYDYDVLVQLDADNDINTGVNGYEDTGRRVSFMQTLLIKYSFIF